MSEKAKTSGCFYTLNATITFSQKFTMSCTWPGNSGIEYFETIMSLAGMKVKEFMVDYSYVIEKHKNGRGHIHAQIYLIHVACLVSDNCKSLQDRYKAYDIIQGLLSKKIGNTRISWDVKKETIIRNGEDDKPREFPTYMHYMAKENTYYWHIPGCNSRDKYTCKFKFPITLKSRLPID